MNTWHEALRARLDVLAAPLVVFFRDDDAGPVDERLYRLLDLFAVYALPLDLAVIPDALEQATARTLLARHAECPHRLGLHQHGLRHANHEPQGRKCEFGEVRDAEQQQRDIATGRARLGDALGDALDPIFTPPWNRCTQATVAALRQSGLRALSRNVGAAPLCTHGLREIDVTFDWCRARRPQPADVAGAIAARAALAQPLGVMLHHAVMHAEHFDAIEQVLEVLARHPRVQCVAMRDLLDAPPTTLRRTSDADSLAIDSYHP